MVMRSDSSNFSPVIGSVPFSAMYLNMRRRSYTWPDFCETTGSCGGSPEIAQKNMEDANKTLGGPLTPIDGQHDDIIYSIQSDLNTSIAHISPPVMPSKSPADNLIEKATRKFDGAGKGGWLSFGSSSSSKFEEAGDIFQQAANQYKIDKDFKSAGDAFAKEAECREKAGETNDAANAWWNAAKAYKQSNPDRALDLPCHACLLSCLTLYDSGY